jgi:hypothetical protein
MIDECQNSPTYKHLFSKRGWFVIFKENIFYGSLAPRGTILTRHNIDSITFSKSDSAFRQLEKEYGEFWFERSTDTMGSETVPIFDLNFQNYADLEIINSFLYSMTDVSSAGFRYPFRGGAHVESQPDVITLIKVYPNPTSENISISFPQNQSFKNTKLLLRDITGREIFF